MESPVRYKRRCVHVDGELTVYTCRELKPQLLKQLTVHPDAATLDLSRVSEIDTAGLQLLLIARRHAREGGRELRIKNPSQVVSEVLELCRLGEWLAHGSSDRAASEGIPSGDGLAPAKQAVAR
jgi:anti-sigma B factor antagonist